MDAIFSCLGIGAHRDPTKLQLFICLLNLIFSILPTVMYIWVSVNIHVIFWLGMAPQYANLCVPISLCFLNLGTIVVKHFAKARQSKIWCFILFLTLGSIMLGVGLYVMFLAWNVSSDLIHQCGASTLTAQLESEWQQLNAFYQQCYAMQGRLQLIEQCPGFAQTFPNRVFANYLEDIEYDYNCVGFCQFWSQPLFNMDADRKKRCATAIGEEMDFIGNIVGAPTMVVGAFVVTMGICLSLYDHL